MNTYTPKCYKCCSTYDNCGMAVLMHLVIITRLRKLFLFSLVAEQIKIHNPGAHQSNHVPIPPSVQQTYSTSDIQGFYDKDIPLTTSSSQCSTLSKCIAYISMGILKILLFIIKQYF